jgi:hypothetical protein
VQRRSKVAAMPKKRSSIALLSVTLNRAADAERSYDKRNFSDSCGGVDR